MFIAILLLSFCFNLLVAVQEKPMVVVVPSYNNAQWYRRNLDSICFQNYQNYRVIYIDDCSPDGTGALVAEYVDEYDLHDKVTLIRNARNCGAMANHYRAAWMCADDEIVVHVDGDDWLKHNDVLARVNEEYQNSDVWLTYGQFERFPDGQKGYCRPMQPAVIQWNAYRECDWVTSHLRTFYAGLFKQIKLKDFMYHGGYFPVTCDMAMFFPLLELAGKHARCISDVLYVYNEQTELNDYKKRLLLQLHCDKVIRSRAKYQQALSYKRAQPSEQIDILIFLTGSSNVVELLDQLTDCLPAGCNITILYNDAHRSQAAWLESLFPSLGYICYEKNLTEVFDTIASSDGYLCCLDDHCAIRRPLSLDIALESLRQTGALAFHLNLGTDVSRTRLLKRDQRVPRLLAIDDQICAWQYKDGEFDWKDPFQFMSLYSKDHVKSIINGAQISDLEDFKEVMRSGLVDQEDVGLCYLSACMQSFDTFALCQKAHCKHSG